ncbi:uncharacterized protein LOC111381094 isoform X3 [Olea europaea var. sylvestris]|uniref:uncharacterized protein LOC111381094 isoform X3 n=1 Tax=Olea europaea var. sylvestris TaxID=158386 RepID=UPI000C1D4D23|nr:uncharacterized protein LOC111381094 isoform X3 [Olea europaea var. sylvestris]
MEKIPIYQSNQKIEDSEKIDLAAEAISLMDLSSQNDNQFSGVLGSEKEVNTTLEIDVDHHTPQLRQSTDHEKARRNGRCNLRKSLAWDSAFFSNAGVLDPEELSTMIKVAEKDKNQLLPGIKEEIRRSIDSISSLESDNLTVESLEDDLFVDIRASIQRSNKKVPNATNYISKSAAMEIDNQAIAKTALKKESIASQKKLLVKPGLKNTSRQTIRMPKCQPKQNIGKQESGKAVKQDSGHSQVTQTVTKTDEPSSLRPKPPKAVSRATLTSTSATKRDSTGSSHVKSEIGSSKLRPVTSSTKGSQASKVPVLSGARRALPKPAASSNSSSLGTSTTSKMLSTRSSTSSDSFDSMLSKTTANSPLMSARRIPVKSSTIRQASSDSIPKTPSKAALQNKPLPSTLSAYLRSTKISSSVSPASSISEWSSASSSSTVYQRSSNSRNSLDISSCPSIDDSVVPLGLRSTDGIADEYKSKGTALPGNISNKSITQSGTLQAPAKLSGLRKPSPKIGFFDAAKSIRTPNGTLRIQSDLGNVLMKIGAAVCSPKGSSNIKPKTGKFPTSRAVSSLANVKPGSPKSRSPASFPERSRALTNDSQALSGVKDSPSLSPEAQGNRSGENILKLQKVQAKVPDGNKKVLDAGTGAVMNKNPDELIEEAAFNMHRNIRREDIEAVLVEDNNAMGSKSIGQKVDKDVLDDENHWKCLSSILKTTEDKQELSGSKEYVNSNVYSQKGEPLSDISDSVSASFPETASTTTASRAPFDLMDSFYNSECPDFSKESAAQLVEKIVIPLPITEQKENI